MNCKKCDPCKKPAPRIDGLLGKVPNLKVWNPKKKRKHRIQILPSEDLDHLGLLAQDPSFFELVDAPCSGYGLVIDGNGISIFFPGVN